MNYLLEHVFRGSIMRMVNMMIPMTSWSSLGGGGAKVSGWKPGGEESPPTGLGLKTMAIMTDHNNDGQQQ